MLHSLPVSDNGFFIRCHPLGEKASISYGKSFHYAPPPERNLFIASANILNIICSKFLHHGPLVIWIILSTELANPLWNFYTPQIQWVTLFHFCLFSAACRGLYARRITLTSSNGKIFCVTGLLCGEFTGLQWVPRTKASDAELWCFLWSAPEPTVEQTMETLVIWDADCDVIVMMRHGQCLITANETVPIYSLLWI